MEYFLNNKKRKYNQGFWLRSCKGFTLLETLIAIVILTFASIAVINSFARGLFVASDNENVEIAINIGQAKLEELKNTDFSLLADEAAVQDITFPRFTTTVDVKEGQDPMQIDVTVSWNVKGAVVSEVFSTLRTEY